MSALTVLMEGYDIGVLEKKRGALRFTYTEQWQRRPGSYPLSLSMPLASAEHDHPAVEPFLWGLLPDNDLILSRWAKRFQVSSRSAFDLLANVGADCRPSPTARLNLVIVSTSRDDGALPPKRRSPGLAQRACGRSGRAWSCAGGSTSA